MTLVLDSEGLAKAVLRDRELTAWLAAARAEDERVITSAATLVEVIHPRINRPSLEWVISRVSVEPVTAEIARQAGVLLEQAGRHGHKYALDAMLAGRQGVNPHPRVSDLTQPRQSRNATYAVRATRLPVNVLNGGGMRIEPG